MPLKHAVSLLVPGELLVAGGQLFALLSTLNSFVFFNHKEILLVVFVQLTPVTVSWAFGRLLLLQLAGFERCLVQTEGWASLLPLAALPGEVSLN